MRKIIFILVFALFITFVPVSYAAAKVGVGSKLSNGNLNLTFSNPNSAKSISYEMTYNRSGGQEGVYGTVGTKGKGTVLKKILLGTCSTRTCTYHKNISNIKVKVTIVYKNGKVEVKVIKVKI